MPKGEKQVGIQLEIGADASSFLKELKKVDKEINSTEKSARTLMKSLKLDFDPTVYDVAQQKLRHAMEETEQKAGNLRKKLKELQDAGKVDTEEYEQLQEALVKTNIKANDLKKDLEKLEEIKFASMNKGLTEASDKLKKMSEKTKALSIASAAAVGGMVALAKATAASGAELQDYSDRLNVSAESLQRWQYIAMQSGVENNKLYQGFTKARDAIGTAMSGTVNNATKVLQTLTGDISRLPNTTEGAFNTIIDALAQVEDKTMQAYYANEIFGEKLATDLIPMVNNGAEKLKQLNAEFDSIGYLSDEQVQGLADFDDKLNIVRKKLDLAKSELGIALLPVLETLSKFLTDTLVPAMKGFAEWFENLNDRTRNFITTALLLTAALSPILGILSKIIGVIPKLIKLIGTMNVQTWKTVGGYLALGAAMLSITDLIANWEKMSTVEKILKALGVAALTAAAAVAVFHASWSVGIAVGVIAAGITAAIAAIKAAAEETGVDVGWSDEKTLEKSVGVSETELAQTANNTGAEKPETGGSVSNTYNEDNSTYEIQIAVEGSGNKDYDAKELAEEVIRQIQVRKQAGR